MSSVGEENWNQPSQPSTNQGLQPAPLTPPSPKFRTNSRSDTTKKIEEINSVDGPVSWHRFVTIEHHNPEQSPLPVKTDTIVSSYHPIDDFHSTDDSSTAVSVSYPSRSPSITHKLLQSPLEDAQVMTSTNHSTENPSLASVRVSQWTRKKYPLQMFTEAPKGQQTPPLSPIEGQAQSSVHTPLSKPKVEVKRTLRRTPRSRRIQLRAANPLESRHYTDSDRSSTSSVESVPRSRRVSISSSITPPTDHSTVSSPDPPKAAPPNGPRAPPPTQAQGPSTIYPATIPIHQQTLSPTVASPTITSPSFARRQAYPLQPTTLSPVVDDETPPYSVHDQESSSDDQQDQHRPLANLSWRKRAYPLYRPASIVSLSKPSTLATVTKAPDKPIQPPSSKSQEKAQPAPEKKQWQRRRYPLQSPASNMALRRSPSPPATPPQEERHTNPTAEQESSHDPVKPADQQSFRRPSYPAQSAVANTSKSRPQLAPLTTAQTDPPKKIDNTEQARKDQLAKETIDIWKRELYPVQSPKNVPPAHRFPDIESKVEEADTTKDADHIHLPKNIVALKDQKIPLTKGRTIIVCLDGTGDKFDNDNSNIVHIISALKKDDPHQVSYYQAGIGTYNAGGLSWGFSAAADMAVGSGLGLHVRDAYHFLMHSYKEGDRICIFGFSRGAYTARCLAGMIHKVGLLPPRNLQQIPFAYDFYTQDTPEGWKQSKEFKRTFSIDVCVHFIGCFDSVASVGFIPRQLPLSSTPNNKARYFRHAMALDERRAKFKVCRHQGKTWEQIDKAASPASLPTRTVVKPTEMPHLHHWSMFKDQDDAPPSYSEHIKYGRHHHPNITDEEYERLTGHEAPFNTDVYEVWFAGAHADVGGGAVPNEERHKLAQIPLRWMIRQTFECNTGIIWKAKVLAEFGLDVHTLWPKYGNLSVPAHGPPPSYLEKFTGALPPRSVRRSKLVPIKRFEKGEHFYHLNSYTDEDWTPEQVEDFYDAMTPINDQLVQRPAWWILETLPVEYVVPKMPGEAVTRTGMNLGRYRGVPDQIPNVHWTVFQRQQQLGYKIRARTAAHTTWKAVT